MAELPSEQELADALRRISVRDVLIETAQGLASLGYHKLGEESRNLEETRLAIEALRALSGVLEGTAPEQLTRDLAQTIANLQLAYAEAAATTAPEQRQ